MGAARNFPADGGSSTSTVSGGVYSLGTQGKILSRLKMQLFHVDLITHLEVFPADGPKVKEVLQKVDVHTAPP